MSLIKNQEDFQENLENEVEDFDYQFAEWEENQLKTAAEKESFFTVFNLTNTYPF